MANSTSHHHPSASNSLGDNCSGANKSSQQYCLKWSNYSTNLVRTFGQMIMDENFVDVTLACEGQAIKAHKVVLSACSNYFKELFLANPCKHPIVILKDMKMEDLKTILDFMYKGEVNIFNHQLGALLKTADILKVKGLTESKDDEYDECHNQENTPPNNNTSNVNNNPISDLDKSGNLPYSGDRLLSVDRHPESSVNHIHSSAQSIYQAQLPPTSNQQIFHQPQTFHAPSSTPQSLPPPLTHDSNNQLKLSSSQESFKNSQQLQKPCSINRKKRRRRSKRVNDGLSMDRGGESDSGSMMSGDEETAIKKESKGRDDVISTPSCTATSSALDTNSNSNTVQSNNNSQSQEPNHSLTTGRKKLSLSTISQNVQSSNQDVLENSNFSHVDDVRKNYPICHCFDLLKNLNSYRALSHGTMMDRFS